MKTITGRVHKIYTDKDPYKIGLGNNFYSVFEEKQGEIEDIDVGDRVEIKYTQNGQYRNLQEVNILKKAPKEENSEIDGYNIKLKAAMLTASVFKGEGNNANPNKIKEINNTFKEILTED